MARSIRRLALLAALILSFAGRAQAASVTVGWDPNPEPNVRYVVYWGIQHLVYPNSGSATTALSYTVDNLVSGQTYYFAVQAVSADGLTSPMSDEVVYTVPGVGLSRFGDYNGDGRADTTSFRCTTGEWFLSGASTAVAVLGQCGDKPVPADYDGDGRTDVAVWRPSTGMWFVLKSGDGYAAGTMISAQWGAGQMGDVPLPGDYDGDGKADFAVYRPSAGTWWVLRSATAYTTYASYQWGLETTGDVPVPADYDGDGKVDPAVWRPMTGTWWVLRSAGSYRNYFALQWGYQGAGDVPVPADYDGDKKADPAVWRASTGTWWVLRSAESFTRNESHQWGSQSAGDLAVPEDFDGDGKADLAVWRPSTGTWWILRSAEGYTMYSSLQGGTQAQGYTLVQPVVR